MIKKIGICGVGFVGSAIYAFFSTDDQFELKLHDKYKSGNPLFSASLKDLTTCDLIYVCLPTPFLQNGFKTEEIELVLTELAEFEYPGIILIKSTVLPPFCRTMSQRHPYLTIIHNPEFLSAATAVQDFQEQKHIVLGYCSDASQFMVNTVAAFYESLFPLATVSVTNAETSALVKLACNSFYATKVQFFTELFLLCEKDKEGTDFALVRRLMLKNEWINERHTLVPGPDGQISFGGACFPKDLQALISYMDSHSNSCQVLKAVSEEQKEMRNVI